MRNRIESVNLQHLVNRIKMNKHFIERCPERRYLFEAKIKETEELIVKTVMQNDGHLALNQIKVIAED